MAEDKKDSKVRMPGRYQISVDMRVREDEKDEKKDGEKLKEVKKAGSALSKCSNVLVPRTDISYQIVNLAA